MNFLAHFTLAFGQEDLLVGQFIADAVKGQKFNDYPEGIRNGILLHRFIDSETDTSEVLKPVRIAARPHVGLFSPVIVDLILDHLLARDYMRITGNDLAAFSSACTRTLHGKAANIPDRLLPALEAMERYRWLEGYAHLEGIAKSIQGMSRRVPSGERLLPILPHLQTLVNEGEKVFEAYFSALSTACLNKLDTFGRGEIGPN